MNNNRHGMDGTRECILWRSVLNRCYSTKNKDYKYYGKRGILVCEFLRASPANIFILIGNRLHGMTLDRPDNNGHYSCGSCAECLTKKWPKNIRWASRLDQVRNRRTTRTVIVKGKRWYVKELAARCGLIYNTLLRRIDKGDEGSILRPSQKNKKLIKIGGYSKTINEWCDISGISRSTMKTRIRLGIKGKKLLNPPKPIGRHYSRTL